MLSELVGSKDVKLELVETVTVRSANFMLRYSKTRLHTDSHYREIFFPKDEQLCVV